ncbi:pilin [Candidatus Saccharibacteria bacterium]|nr:pilin [Candidatus Saccharibacteria bacterium]
MKLIHKISLAIVTLMTLFVMTPSFALAAAGCTPPLTPKEAIDCGSGGASGGGSPSDLNDTVENILNILSIIVGVAAIFMIIFAGLRFITSAGNAERAKAARQTLLYAVIGLVIVAMAQIIVWFVLTEATNPETVNNSTGSSSSSTTNPGRTGAGAGERPN